MLKDLLPSFSPKEDLTEQGYLEQLCVEGIVLRYGRQTPRMDVDERLRLELDFLTHTGFIKHFLLMRDIVHYAKNNGIPVGPGRDWQPSSLIAYVLGITDVDSLRHGLIFEMRLNPERIAQPWMAIDIAYNHRDELIAYIYRKYGENIVPVPGDEEDQTITQDARFDLLMRGRIVLDIHPRKNLAVNQTSLRLIREKGMNIALDDRPFDDPETYKLLGDGFILGLFQAVFPLAPDVFRCIKPSNIQDIAAVVALSAIGSEEYIALYAARKNKEVPTTYEHQFLESILQETYGIMLYQEQYVQAVEFLTGYTRGSADLLRRANLRGDPLLMATHLPRFIEGCAKTNSIPADIAIQLFNCLNKAKRYFPKDYAIASSILAYRSAHLKAYHSPEFYSALTEHNVDDPEFILKIQSEINARNPI
jgi:DNA polymerase III alpha subunit